MWVVNQRIHRRVGRSEPGRSKRKTVWLKEWLYLEEEQQRNREERTWTDGVGLSSLLVFDA